MIPLKFAVMYSFVLSLMKKVKTKGLITSMTSFDTTKVKVTIRIRVYLSKFLEYFT